MLLVQIPVVIFYSRILSKLLMKEFQIELINGLLVAGSAGGLGLVLAPVSCVSACSSCLVGLIHPNVFNSGNWSVISSIWGSAGGLHSRIGFSLREAAELARPHTCQRRCPSGRCQSLPGCGCSRPRGLLVRSGSGQLQRSRPRLPPRSRTPGPSRGCERRDQKCFCRGWSRLGFWAGRSSQRLRKAIRRCHRASIRTRLADSLRRYDQPYVRSQLSAVHFSGVMRRRLSRRIGRGGEVHVSGWTWDVSRRRNRDSRNFWTQRSSCSGRHRRRHKDSPQEQWSSSSTVSADRGCCSVRQLRLHYEGPRAYL